VLFRVSRGLAISRRVNVLCVDLLICIFAASPFYPYLFLCICAFLLMMSTLVLQFLLVTRPTSGLSTHVRNEIERPFLHPISVRWSRQLTLFRIRKRAANDVYSWTGSSWEQVPGKLSRVSVSAGGSRVVGVAPDGGVVFWQKDRKEWVRISGTLVNISVAESHLIGVTKSAEIFHIAL
jgi:hypothetical protein